MYSITNISSLPTKGQPISFGFFRGLTFAVAPTNNLVLQVLFGNATLPTADSTTSKALTTSPSPPTMVNNPTRGFVPFFSGTQYMNVSSLNLPPSYTKSVCIFLTQALTTNGNILSSADSASTSDAMDKHYMWFSNKTNFGAGHGNPTNAYVQDPVATPLNTWVHYVVTYNNSTTRMVLYKNGTQVASTTDAALSWSGGVVSGVQIGAYIDTTSPFVGYIDNVRIYSSPLSSSSVTQLYNADVAAGV
jgi:hypothetical protein